MAKSTQKCAVFYAVTAKGPFLLQVENSVTSLRRFNSEIPVYIFVFGGLSTHIKKRFQKLNVTFIQRPAIGKTYPYFVKWMALEMMLEERVLFLDADTYLFGDVSRLFKSYKKFDFYARKEGGTRRKAYFIGKTRIAPVIHYSVLNDLFKKLKGQPVPVFNAGIMLFNNGVHRKIKLRKILSLYRKITSGTWPYPSINPHIRGEIILSLTLATLKGFRWGVFPKGTTPFFRELIEKDVKEPGLIVHVIHHLYLEFLKTRYYKNYGGAR